MRKLERLIRNFIYKINPQIKVVFSDFTESQSLEKIVFFDINDFIFESNDEFCHYISLRKKGMILDILLCTFMILHEIGHIQTISKYKNPIAILTQYQKRVDNLLFIQSDFAQLQEYKKLQLEKDADNFAYNFYLHNYNLVKDFDNKVRELLF